MSVDVETLTTVVWGFALATGVAGCVLAFSRVLIDRRANDRRAAVVVQCEPPDDLPPLLAGPILGVTRGTASSQLVHLAVTGVIRIEEGQRGQESTLKLVDPDRCSNAIDRQAVEALFPSGIPGECRWASLGDRGFAKTMGELLDGGQMTAVSLGHQEPLRNPIARGLGIATFVLLAPLLLLLATRLQTQPFLSWLSSTAVTLGIPAIFGIIAARRRYRRLPLGDETHRYLLGLKHFLRLPEYDRVAILNSRSGADQGAAAIPMFRHYERLLPYAMLFGLEREWCRVLEARYREDGRPPVWFWGGYGGSGSVVVVPLEQSLARFEYAVDGRPPVAGSGGGSGGGG